MQRVDGLDLVAEHLDADGELLVHRDDLDGVAPHAEVAAREVDVVALVLHRDELADEPVAVDALADLQGDHGVQVFLGGTEAVDAGHRRDDDDVAAADSSELVVEWRRRSTSALIERVFLDEGVGLRNVRLGLVVVVVGDEVLDRVVGHELAELVGELGGQRLVVREHEGGPLHLLDEPGRGRRLARSRGAEEHDIRLARVDAAGQFGDRLRLVAARGVFADDLEGAHGAGGLHYSSLGSDLRQPQGVYGLAGYSGSKALTPVSAAESAQSLAAESGSTA